MSGRVAVVTGGVGGIGTEMCKALAKAGYRVVATYAPFEKDNIPQWQEERKAEGVEVAAYEVEVTDFNSCQAALAKIEAEVGPVDVLVNNAGITRDNTMRKMDVEQWQAVINTNLNSVFNMTRPVFPGMVERKFGRIVNISSINGRKGQFGQANYAAAKAGMHGFTMSLAQEGAAKGVTTNTISPGYIGTKMVLSIPKEYMDKIVAQIPVGRLGKPEEIARLVVFLVSDDSGFITGANIDINGGQLIH